MIFGESRLKDLYRKALWGPGRRLIGALPPPADLALLQSGGAVAGVALRRRRRDLIENLRRAFPDAAPDWLRQTAAAAFAAHFANQYFSLCLPQITPKTVGQYLRWEGLPLLDAARAQGKGVVLMHPHMGPAQLPLHALGLMGLSMHQIGGGRVVAVSLSPTGQWAAQTRARLEKAMPVTLHDGRGFLRPVLRALSAGAVVMTACDATGGGEELGRRGLRTVLGQSFPVPYGPARLALLSGAPLLLLSCHRGGDALYTATIEEVDPWARGGDRSVALERGLTVTAAALDRALRRWPGDWLFWDGFHPGGLLPGPASPSAGQGAG